MHGSDVRDPHSPAVLRIGHGIVDTPVDDLAPMRQRYSIVVVG